MSPKFCQRQVLPFYVESEPRGTSPVPIMTPWKYAICPDREPRTFGLAYVRANHEATAALCMLQMRSAKEVIAIMFEHMTDNENDNRFNLQRGEVTTIT